MLEYQFLFLWQVHPYFWMLPETFSLFIKVLFFKKFVLRYSAHIFPIRNSPLGKYNNLEVYLIHDSSVFVTNRSFLTTDFNLIYVSKARTISKVIWRCLANYHFIKMAPYFPSEVLLWWRYSFTYNRLIKLFVELNICVLIMHHCHGLDLFCLIHKFPSNWNKTL